MVYVVKGRICHVVKGMCEAVKRESPVWNKVGVAEGCTLFPWGDLSDPLIT